MADGQTAPTLDKIALPSTGPQVPPSGVDPSRLMAAIRYGWAIEELVYRLGDWFAHLADQNAGGTVQPDFPLDFTGQRSHAEYVRELRSVFQADGKKLLDTAPAPASATNVDDGIANLLSAYESGKDVKAYLDPTTDSRISASVRLWDRDMVDLIIDRPPEVLAAYELGKALSITQWHLHLAHAQDAARAPNTPDLLPDAWLTELNKARITEIRDHLTTLSSTLDAATLVSVSASMGFWRRAYELGGLKRNLAAAGSRGPGGFLKVSSPPAKGGAQLPPPKDCIPPSGDDRKDVLAALDQQLANWYDLLTGRRLLSSFPVTGFVSHLMRKYAQSWWTQLGPSVLVGASVVVAIVLVGVLIWAIFGSTITAAAGVTGGLTTLLGYFVARGTGLLDSGSRELQTRVGELQSRLSALMSSSQAQPQLTFSSLAGSVLTQVVEQIRLEESKLAVSQPLVEYIMDADLSSKGPEQIAQDFLKKILQGDGQSNLDRLQNVLGGLYQSYKPLIPGAP